MSGNLWNRRSTYLTVTALALLAGLALARRVPPAPVWPAVISAVLAAGAAYRRRRQAVVWCILFGLAAGIWRGGGFMQRAAVYGELQRQPVSLRTRAVNDAVYGNRSQLEFEADSVVLESPYRAELPGRIRVSGFGERMVYQGDVVQASGRLQLSRGSTQARLTFARLTAVERSQSVVAAIRRQLGAGLQNALPEPLASFAMGILIGQRSTLDAQTMQALSATGLTHIIAVSGYNLTILINAVRRQSRLGSKYQKLLFSLAFMAAFVLLTGFSASIVRAAAVSTLGLLAWYYGRTFKPLTLISLVAASTAMINPFYVWSDIGWYLSFLAFFGILVAVPIIKRRFARLRPAGFMGTIVQETAAAQIMTMPLLLYIFGSVSLTALPANLLVAPLIPLAMVLAAVAGVSGMAAPALAGWLAWPARLVLTVIIDTAVLLARVSRSALSGRLVVWQLLACYGVIMCLLLLLWARSRRQQAIAAPGDRTLPLGPAPLI